MNYSSQLNLENTFGDFIENLPSSQEYLMLSFSPSSIPLKQRWRNNCLSADFLADYLSTFVAEEEDKINKKMELKNAVSYIANELLENAMKYSKSANSFPISIQIYLSKNNIIFKLINSMDLSNLKSFQSYIENLIKSDPYELYLSQLEKNAIDDHHENSGLGFLTMLNDYGAKLGWKFETISSRAITTEEVCVTTTVQLEV